MSNDIFYVYAYMRNDNTPYYIGKGSNGRYKENHLYVDVPVDRDKIVFLAENMSEEDAFDFEEELTLSYGLLIDNTGILENKVHGGHNVHVPSFTGHKHTEESKRKISEKLTGKTRSEEQKKNYRKPKSKEHAENIRQANLGRKDSKKRREANRKGAMKPEVRERKRQAMKKIIAERKAQGYGWGKTYNTRIGDST